MDKRKRVLVVLFVLLLTTAGNMVRITMNSNIRLVDYIIILSTGAIFGLLICQIFSGNTKKQ